MWKLVLVPLTLTLAIMGLMFIIPKLERNTAYKVIAYIWTATFLAFVLLSVIVNFF